MWVNEQMESGVSTRPGHRLVTVSETEGAARLGSKDNPP